VEETTALPSCNDSEGMKMLVARASARKDGVLVEILGLGSSGVMGNVPA